ncbi:MAG: hypothetical protein EP348_04630 [Alphaproteobacteria bacterium]|nr:MAG: hypothetical protein EP348_04630 [Alphaproteobacteria bacterium]
MAWRQESPEREEQLIFATIELDNVQALYAEFENRGVEFEQYLMEQVWGRTDFHARDPDGSKISFYNITRPNHIERIGRKSLT